MIVQKDDFMKPVSHLFCIALLAACPGLLMADDPTGDPIQAHWIPPELLLQHRVEIGLTDQQIVKIRSLMEEAGPIVAQYQRRLDDAKGRIARLLAAVSVDEEAALKQLDEILRNESEVRRRHLRVMIQIRNEMNAEQQKRAVTLRQRVQDRRRLEQRLQAKITRIEKEIRSRFQAGAPAHDIMDSLQTFPAFMEKGQVKEAEALLDRLLEALDVKDVHKSDLNDKKQLDKFRRTTDETQYLILPIREAGHLYSGRTAQLEEAIKEMRRRLGPISDPTKRNWGYHMILPMWRLDPEHLFNENAHPQTLARAVRCAFDVALSQDVAVYFTVENLEWANRPDLWNYADQDKPGYDPDNVQNVEWLDWDGTPHPHRYRDWGTPEQMPPVICYNSPEVLAEMSRLARVVISPVIAAGLKRLEQAGKAHLFAGVTVGAAPSLPNYEGIERMNPRIAQMMESDGVPRCRLGYNALTNLGYSKDNPPEDFAAALAKVNQDYFSYLAAQLSAGGVPADKMYSHVAAGAGVIGSPGVKFTNAPISIAVVDSCRPGWTTYPVGPFRNDFRLLYEVLAAHGNPPWASTEASPQLGQGGIPMKEYLSRHYDFGATVVVFNTGATSPELSSRLDAAVWGAKAMQAYRDFLGPGL